MQAVAALDFQAWEAVGTVLLIAAAILGLVGWATSSRHTTEPIALVLGAVGAVLASARILAGFGPRAFWILILTFDLIFLVLMTARVVRLRRERPSAMDPVGRYPDHDQAVENEGDVGESVERHSSCMPKRTDLAEDSPESRTLDSDQGRESR